MKKKNSYLVVLPLLSIFLISEINNLNANVFLNEKVNDNPYIEDSQNSVQMIENSETQTGSKILLNVEDNDSQDFLNHTSSSIDFSEEINPESDVPINAKLNFINEESDISSNKYVFEFNNEDLPVGSGFYYLYRIIDPGFAFQENTNELISNLYFNSNSGNEENDVTIESSSTMYFILEKDIKDSFPFIETKEINEQNPLYDINYLDNKVTFKIDGTNLNNVPSFSGEAEGNIHITLKDDEGNYQTLSASLINEVDNVYSYEISYPFENRTYTFSSIINSKITIFDGTDEDYNPSSSISFVDDLGMEEKDLSFVVNNETISNPYIISEGFEINENSATSDSIQFTLTVVDNATNSFKNKLTNNSKISVSLSNSTKSLFETTATWLGDSSENKYTFEIKGLNKSTDYEIISLNDLGIAVGDSISNIDSSIEVISELNSDGHFSTIDSNPYILKDGFEVNTNSIQKDSVEFNLYVENWDSNGNTSYENNSGDMKVKISDSDQKIEEYDIEFINYDQEQSKYTYRVNDLEQGKEYAFFSLVNFGLATEEDGSIQNEIDLNIFLSNQEDLIFTTLSPETKNNSFNFLWLILPIVLIIFIFIGGYWYLSKRKKSKI